MASYEWHGLDAMMRLEKPGTFNLSLLSPATLEGQWAAGRTVVRRAPELTEFKDSLITKRSGPVIAHVTLRPSVLPWWKEVAQLWVHPDHRGNGFQREIVCELIARTPPETRHFCITSNGSAMRVLQEFHFRPVTFRSAGPANTVEDWAKRVGIGGVEERLPVSALYRAFPPNPQDGERWLFLR